MLVRANRINDTVNEERQSLAGTFSLGILPTIAPYLLPRFFTRLQREHPEADIRVMEMKTADIKKAVKRFLLDAASAVRLDELEAFNQTSLYYEQFIAYVAETDPLFNNKNIKTSDLGNEFLWLLDEGHCFRDQLVKFCDLKSATESNSKYSLGSIETFMRMVENGQGVTFIPELALSQLSDKQMRLVRPFALPIPVRDVVLLTTKTFVRHSMAELIIKSVKDNMPQSMLTYNNT